MVDSTPTPDNASEPENTPDEAQVADEAPAVVPPFPAPSEQKTAPVAEKKDNGMIWRVLTALFAAIAVGLGIWAFTLNSQVSAEKDNVASAEATNADLQKQVTDLEAEVKSTKKGEKQTKEELQQAQESAKKTTDRLEARLTKSQDAVQSLKNSDNEFAQEYASELDSINNEMNTILKDVEKLDDIANASTFNATKYNELYTQVLDDIEKVEEQITSLVSEIARDLKTS